MAVGAFTGIVHGVSLPLLMLVWGELINVFIYQEQSSGTSECLNVSRSCSNVFIAANSSVEILPCGVNATLFNGLTLRESVEEIFGSTSKCLTDNEFEDEVFLYCIYFSIMGVVVLVFGYIQITFFQMACERQVRKIRLLFYRSVLRQNIGWFDSNPSGDLASRLNEWVCAFHNGLGEWVY